MANLPGNGPTNEYNNRALAAGRSTGFWMMPSAIVAVIVILVAGYGYENGWMNSTTVTEHRAVSTDAPSPAAAPSMTPATTPKP